MYMACEEQREDSSSASQSGFTLLEIVVAVAIMAIVVSVSVPLMQRLFQSSQYQSAVNDVVTMLSSARLMAVRQGADVDVLINPQTREISRGDSVHSLPKSLQLEVLGSHELNREGVGVIRFYADGGSSGGYVNLTSEGNATVQVQVDWLLGRVSLCKASCPRL